MPLVACGVFGTAAAPEPSRPALVAPGSPVEVRESRDHPRLSLVERAGDPEAAVALAIAHDLGSQASAMIAELLALRAGGSLAVTDAVAYGSGLTVRSLAANEDEAARFVSATYEALGAPVTDAELRSVRARAATLGMERWATAAEEGIGRCSGELGVGAAAAQTDVTVTRVTEWLTKVRSARSSAYAAVGPRGVLDATAAALETTPPWPSEPVDLDPWPSEDRFDAAPAPGRIATLSTAFRVSDPAIALGAASQLSSGEADLSVRIEAMAPGWAIDSVVATTRPRGGCLRVDLRADPEKDAASAPAAAGLAWLVLDEVEHVLGSARASAWSLDDGVLRSTDPRDAAAVAAWRALSGLLEGGPTRRFASLRLPSGDDGRDGASGFAASVSDALERGERPTFDVVTRVERGQGELWLLAATPCGTAPEGADDAGLRALAVRTLAAGADGATVSVEPWVTPDGVGLLAHGPPLSGSETPAAHAKRIAATLGRALVTRLPRDTLASVRASALSELDAERDPQTAAAFQALVPGHPSWLDPRGGWQRVSSLTSEATLAGARELGTEALRLAVLANRDDTQATVAARTLTRWLRPRRSTTSSCALPEVPVARPGSYTVETRPAGGVGPRALVGVRTPPTASRRGGEAEWTVYLLNRRGGWLERALAVPGLATSARASALGGGTASALVIEIATAGEDPSPAVAQARALLARLATGAVTSVEVDEAREAFRAAERRAALDPRRRIVDAWASLPKPEEPTLQTLKQFHATALGEARHVVVMTRNKP